MNLASREYEPIELRGYRKDLAGVISIPRQNKRALIKFHPLASLLKMQIPRKTCEY